MKVFLFIFILLIMHLDRSWTTSKWAFWLGAAYWPDMMLLASPGRMVASGEVVYVYSGLSGQPIRSNQHRSHVINSCLQLQKLSNQKPVWWMQVITSAIFWVLLEFWSFVVLYYLFLVCTGIPWYNSMMEKLSSSVAACCGCFTECVVMQQSSQVQVRICVEMSSLMEVWALPVVFCSLVS